MGNSQSEQIKHWRPRPRRGRRFVWRPRRGRRPFRVYVQDPRMNEIIIYLLDQLDNCRNKLKEET